MAKIKIMLALIYLMDKNIFLIYLMHNFKKTKFVFIYKNYITYK